MEINPLKLLIPLLFTFILNSQARLTLDPSDHTAFDLLRTDLGLKPTPHPQKPCNHPGVICERRVSNYTSILKITRLVFDSQALDGSVSPAVGKFSELRELTLANNRLSGQLPAQLSSCRNLEILNLKGNRFSGPVPSNVSKLVRLRVLDLSSNRLSGDLSFLKHFPNLEALSVANNLFRGKIPQSLKSFRNLRSFDVSGNDYLQGPIPNLPGVELEQEQVSMVPRRYVFAETANSTRKTNQTSPASSPRSSKKAALPSPSSTSATHKHKKHKKTKEWLLGFLAGATAGSATGLLFSLMVKVLVVIARERKQNGMSIFSPLIKKSEDLEFLTKEDGLANMEMIGRGGCGEVYKAELPGSNGKMIAIKKIIQPSKEAAEIADEESKQLTKKMRQIRSEIQTVGQVRHRNLLPLLAHVSRPNCHYLVYEYMKNGSLQDLLTQASNGTRELDWIMRHKIAIGVASGLEYLHINNTPKIIHRDLKPANILLDDDMEPRIADFGLAKPMPEADTHVSSSNVAGTMGYIAPEYHQTLKFTEKCDVYSFGVVLGVLVMGRLPSDEFFLATQDMGLVKWMRKAMISEDPKKAIDSKLAGNGYEEQMLQVLKIACFCTVDNPKERPNSKEIRLMLSQIKQFE